MTPPTWWVRVATLTLVAVTFVGCDWGMNPPPCQCPHFQEAVDSINWAPGLDQREHPFSQGARVDGRLHVSRSFTGDDADPSLLLDRIRRGAVESGFVVVSDEDRRVELSLDELNLEAYTIGRTENRSPGIIVRLLFDGEDSPEVAELLEPIRVALEGA